MIYNRLVSLREYFINIFNKKILFIQDKQNKRLIKSCFFIHYINFLYNNKMGNLKKYNINLVYKIDNIIFFEDFEDKIYNISSVIFDLQILDLELNVVKEMGESIKKYSLNVPFYVIMMLENINKNTKVNFKVMNILTINDIMYDTEKIMNKRLYELL